MASIQLTYLRWSEWKREQAANKDFTMNIVQMKIRELAKIVPMKAVYTSENLRQLVFMEEPFFLFWGMDRLDRLNVDHLPFDYSPDPCERDGEGMNAADETAFAERVARNTETGDGTEGIFSM